MQILADTIADTRYKVQDTRYKILELRANGLPEVVCTGTDSRYKELDTGYLKQDTRY